MVEIPWFKVDDQLYSHPKWLSVTPAARGLWVSAGSWCAAQLTDGLVPRHVLPVLGGRPRDAADLVRAGLWLVEGNDWRFHDWADMQPTAEQVQEDRAAARDRMARLRANRRSSSPDVRANTERSSGDVPNPDPSRPCNTPQPPASGGHDGQHPNCRSCGTNRRPPKPEPNPRPLLPPNSAPEHLADFTPPEPEPIDPDDARRARLAIAAMRLTPQEPAT